MSIRRLAAFSLQAGFVAAGAVLAAAGGARADSNELQVCAQQYQAAKADNKLNGQAWQDFYPDCKAHVAPAAAAKAEPAQPATAPAEQAPAPKAEAPVEAAAPAPAPTPVAAPDKKDTVGAGERDKKCRAQWKAEEAALKKKDPKLTLAKFLKHCVEHPKNAGK